MLHSWESFVEYVRMSDDRIFGIYNERLEYALKLYYGNGQQVIIFKCYWFDNTRHVKVDRHPIIMIDVK